MKYLIILTDGMADYKIDELGMRTPLQVASTPNMDRLAASSVLGQVRTVPPGFPPGSDVANLSVMGYAPQQYYTGRSPLEAVSMGVELGPTDLALRCNLVTLSGEADYQAKTMLDYSAGEISSAESGQLINTIQNSLGNDQFHFYAGISYRHLLVWKKAVDKRLELTPPHDISDRIIKEYLPAGPDAASLLELMVKSEGILASHPVNEARLAEGLKPATSIWFWGQGSKPALPGFYEKYKLKGSVVSAVDLVKGLGICAGLTPIKVAGATGGIVTDFAGKARAALNELKGDQDFVYLHIESPDEAGHQGEMARKIWSIEQIDQHVIGQLINELDSFEDIRVLVLPDHPTPIAVRTHTSDPVPFMLFDKNHPVDSKSAVFDEDTAARGRFFESGPELMDFFITGQ